MCGEFGKSVPPKKEQKKSADCVVELAKKTEWKKWLKEKRRLRGAFLFRIGVWYTYEPEVAGAVAAPIVVPKLPLPCAPTVPDVPVTVT